MARDNISGYKSRSLLVNIFLFPGRIFQWFLYMSVGSSKGYGSVRQQTRLARSPIMTFVYSVIGWIAIYYSVQYLLDSGLLADYLRLLFTEPASETREVAL